MATWRAALRENHKEKYGESENDPDATGKIAGGEAAKSATRWRVRFLDELAATAIAEVKKNGVFVLPGIGRLVRVDRKARMGRNPATGEAIKIAAKKVVKFRVAKSAKDAIVPPKKAK